MPAVAEAHGPCPACLQPSQGTPGTELMLDYPTFKAILNPTRRQLTPGPKPNCYGCQLKLWRNRVDGQPAVTLGRWRPRRQGATVRIPAVSPGRYLVALFDGSEGGTHYTWAYLNVEGTQDDSNLAVLIGVVSALALCILAGAVWLIRRRRREPAR